VIDYAQALALPKKQQAEALERVAVAALEAPESRTFGMLILLQMIAQQKAPEALKRLSGLALAAPETGGATGLDDGVNDRVEGWLRRFFRRVIVNNSTADSPGFAEAARAAELPDDACWLKNIRVAQQLNKPEFPADSRLARLSGTVGIEADLTLEQRPATVRVIASSPALVFDEAAKAIFTTPALGQPVFCRGVGQPVFFKASGKPMKQP
jgi:outer membrane biosynthesis protein TonB